MQKKFEFEVEYNEDADNIATTFGTTAERLNEIINDVLHNGEKYNNTFTGALMMKYEAGEITGGDILALASHTFASAQAEMAQRFKDMLGVRDSEED